MKNSECFRLTGLSGSYCGTYKVESDSSILLHSIKLFNLCCIQRNGLTKWWKCSLKSDTAASTAKLAIGQGSQCAAEAR